METASRLTPSDRDRGLRRLRSLTTGVALASAAAGAAFGYLAYVTNPGQQVANAQSDPAAQQPVNAALPQATTAPSHSSSSGSSSTAAPTATPQPAAQPTAGTT